MSVLSPCIGSGAAASRTSLAGYFSEFAMLRPHASVAEQIPRGQLQPCPFFREHLPDRHESEAVGVCREPKGAGSWHFRGNRVVGAFTPSYVGRIVGTLSHTQTVLLALTLEVVAA
jgi:hypothetical protein